MRTPLPVRLVILVLHGAKLKRPAVRERPQFLGLILVCRYSDDFTATADDFFEVGINASKYDRMLVTFAGHPNKKISLSATGRASIKQFIRTR